MDNSSISYNLCPFFSVDRKFNIITSNKEWKKLFFESSLLSDLIDTTMVKEILLDPSVVLPIQIELSLKGEDQGILPYVWTILSSGADRFDFYGYYLGSKKELETRYERMYSSTSDAVMLLSPERFTDCNQATLNIFKLGSVEEFTKCHPADLSPSAQPDGEPSLEKANRMISKALAEGRAFFEWTHRDSTGKDFPCEVLLSKIDINGESYLQASVRDISERMMMQKEVEETRISQINAMRLSSLGEMASGIAHEINSPITTIRAHAELLQRHLKNFKGVDSQQFSKSLATIISTVDRITLIIKGLRSISRESSEDPMVEHNLLELMNETSTLFEEKFRVNNIRYQMEISDKSIRILCRQVEIGQVVLNLMNNSFDALLGIPDPWVKISITCDDKDVYIKFTDSGKGVPAELRSKIFEPFFSTKEVGKGTGLGLSISKNIIENHGGRFSYDQSEAHTTFIVTLPTYNS